MRLASRPPLRRIVAIDRTIRNGKYPNSPSLARELEVAPRTIQRDLEFLRDSLGAPLAFCRRQNGYYYSEPDFHLPYFRLTEGELVALFVAEQALRQYRGTPYEEDLIRAFQKIADSLPDKITIDLTAVAQTHSFRTSAATLHDLETFRRLAAATLQHRRLQLTYWTASRDEVTERTVDPYHLANIDGDWYLIAYCHLREDVRMFSPARIRKLEELARRSSRRPTFLSRATWTAPFASCAVQVNRGTRSGCASRRRPPGTCAKRSGTPRKAWPNNLTAAWR